jgi:hypothetical protein
MFFATKQKFHPSNPAIVQKEIGALPLFLNRRPTTLSIFIHRQGLFHENG